jgi:K+-transporting ATPase ATPase C chain
MARLSPFGRQLLVGLRAMVVFTLVLGLIYPLAVFALGQVAFKHKADGSQVSINGKVIGSSLVGQSFSDAKGNPLPQWFQSRPSVSDYDTNSSGGSNLGPNNSDLVKLVTERKAQVAAFNGVSPAAVPADAVTASWSGLDPDISVAYARLQVSRVAKARGLPSSAVMALVAKHTSGRALGIIGQAHVNVLELNLALTALRP